MPACLVLFLSFTICGIFANNIYDISVPSHTELYPGDYILSNDKNTKFELQSDGNIVLSYFDVTALQWESIWSTSFTFDSDVRLAIQGDGNLVLYSSDGSPKWASGTDSNLRSQFAPNSISVQDKYVALRNSKEGTYWRRPEKTYVNMNCWKPTGPPGDEQVWENEYDEKLDNRGSPGFLNGMDSNHDNSPEDRIFRWRYCGTETSHVGYTDTKELTITHLDTTFYRGCSDVNNGNAALIGVLSEHDNGPEDRVFTWQCGYLENQYMLTDCSWSDKKPSNWDEQIRFECSDDGVIRSIWSEHANREDDRKFRFECCRIMVIDYNFNKIVSLWYLLHSCDGCSTQQYKKTEGIERSTSNTITDTYSKALETSLSVSQEFSYTISKAAGVTGTTTITAGVKGTISRSIAKTISSSMKHSISQESIFECGKTYFYQWTTEAFETINSASASMSIHSGMFLCTNTADPKCPVGFCKDNDCQICTDQYNTTIGSVANPAIKIKQPGEPNDVIFVRNYWYIIFVFIIGIICVLSFIKILFKKFNGHSVVKTISSDDGDDIEKQKLNA